MLDPTIKYFEHCEIGLFGIIKESNDTPKKMERVHVSASVDGSKETDNLIIFPDENDKEAESSQRAAEYAKSQNIQSKQVASLDLLSLSDPIIFDDEKSKLEICQTIKANITDLTGANPTSMTFPPAVPLEWHVSLHRRLIYYEFTITNSRWHISYSFDSISGVAIEDVGDNSVSSDDAIIKETVVFYWKLPPYEIKKRPAKGPVAWTQVKSVSNRYPFNFNMYTKHEITCSDFVLIASVFAKHHAVEMITMLCK